jgi:hypothetical protein
MSIRQRMQIVEKEVKKSFNEKRIIEMENNFQSSQLLTSDRSLSQFLNASRKTSFMRNFNIINEISSRLRPLHAQIKDVQMKDVELIYTTTYTQRATDLHTRTKIDSLQKITHLCSDMKNDRWTASKDDLPSYMYEDRSFHSVRT